MISVQGELARNRELFAPGLRALHGRPIRVDLQALERRKPSRAIERDDIPGEPSVAVVLGGLAPAGAGGDHQHDARRQAPELLGIEPELDPLLEQRQPIAAVSGVEVAPPAVAGTAKGPAAPFATPSADMSARLTTSVARCRPTACMMRPASSFVMPW